MCLCLLPQPTPPKLTTDDVRKERAKETKHDTTIELAALLHEVRECSFGTTVAHRVVVGLVNAV